MLRNDNFYRLSPTIELLLMLLSEFSYQNLFWFFLIEFSLCKPQKP